MHAKASGRRGRRGEEGEGVELQADNRRVMEIYGSLALGVVTVESTPLGSGGQGGAGGSVDLGVARHSLAHLRFQRRRCLLRADRVQTESAV